MRYWQHVGSSATEKLGWAERIDARWAAEGVESSTRGYWTAWVRRFGKFMAPKSLMRYRSRKWKLFVSDENVETLKSGKLSRNRRRGEPGGQMRKFLSGLYPKCVRMRAWSAWRAQRRLRCRAWWEVPGLNFAWAILLLAIISAKGQAGNLKR